MGVKRLKIHLLSCIKGSILTQHCDLSQECLALSLKCFAWIHSLLQGKFTYKLSICESFLASFNELQTTYLKNVGCGNVGGRSHNRKQFYCWQLQSLCAPWENALMMVENLNNAYRNLASLLLRKKNHIETFSCKLKIHREPCRYIKFYETPWISKQAKWQSGKIS